MAIVEAAKGVDVAIAKYRQARPRLEAAVAVWRSALQEAASFDVRSTVAAQSSNGNGAGAQDGH